MGRRPSILRPVRLAPPLVGAGTCVLYDTLASGLPYTTCRNINMYDIVVTLCTLSWATISTISPPIKLISINYVVDYTIMSSPKR